jgi:hypothetical protein
MIMPMVGLGARPLATPYNVTTGRNKMATQRFVLPLSRRRALAAAASVDPRTIQRYLDGQRVASLCSERIERALGDAGLAHLVRGGDAPPPRPTLTANAATLRRLAVVHGVDPRSILRELREPGGVKGMAGERARQAVHELQESTQTTESDHE